MYNIQYTNRFRKDYKLCKKRGMNIELLKELILLFTSTGTHADLFK